MNQPSPRELLKPYNVSRESLAALDAYVSLLVAWQRRINLIGPSTVEHVWTRHVLDAVQLIPLFPPGTKSLADLGAGAGIPGLILGIAGDYTVHLYESNNKKAAFLREATRQAKVNARIHQVRLEDVRWETDQPRVDCVVARALAPLNLLLSYAHPFIAAGALGFFHKGQDVDSELTNATKCWRIDSVKHPSITDSRGVILEVKEAVRVGS